MATLEQTLINFMAQFADVKGIESLRKAFDSAMQTTRFLTDEFRAESEKIAKNDKLSPLGKREKVQEFVGKEAHRVMRARRTLEKIETKFEAKRSALQPKAPDPTNLAAAVARSDLRSMLRGLPIGKRMELLLAPDADPVLLQAALELPGYASGMNDDTRKLVLERVIEREQPGALATIAREQEAIQVLRAATQVVTDTMRSVGEFPNDRVMNQFLQDAVGDTSRLDADIDHELAA